MEGAGGHLAVLRTWGGAPSSGRLAGQGALSPLWDADSHRCFHCAREQKAEKEISTDGHWHIPFYLVNAACRLPPVGGIRPPPSKPRAEASTWRPPAAAGTEAIS